MLILYSSLRASRKIHYLNPNVFNLIFVKLTFKYDLLVGEAGVNSCCFLLQKSFNGVIFNFISYLKSNKIQVGAGCTPTYNVKVLIKDLKSGTKKGKPKIPKNSFADIHIKHFSKDLWKTLIIKQEIRTVYYKSVTCNPEWQFFFISTSSGVLVEEFKFDSEFELKSLISDLKTINH